MSFKNYAPRVNHSRLNDVGYETLIHSEHTYFTMKFLWHYQKKCKIIYLACIESWIKLLRKTDRNKTIYMKIKTLFYLMKLKFLFSVIITCLFFCILWITFNSNLFNYLSKSVCKELVSNFKSSNWNTGKNIPRQNP